MVVVLTGRIESGLAWLNSKSFVLIVKLLRLACTFEFKSVVLLAV